MGYSLRQELDFVEDKLNSLYQEVVEDLYEIAEDFETDISHIPSYVHTVFENFKEEFGKTYEGEEHK